MTITQFTDAGSQRCAPVRARLRLFCFSYAGGSAAVFRNWPHFLPAAVEVQPIELPGHGRRIKEAPIDNITALVEELASTIPLRALPFAFFGHSMGALVSFELTRLLRRQRHPLPECLFVSAYRVPHLPARRSQARASLSDRELIGHLEELGGTPKEVLRNPELMRLLLPALRADFQLCDTYTYVTEPPLPCPIVAFGGLQDPIVSQQELRAWQEQTLASFALHMLPGDHFFLNSIQPLFLAVLHRVLAELFDLSQDDQSFFQQPRFTRLAVPGAT
ncbi:MAG TPA: alpha/beta fold hydrolase [Ktedonobacteraceae bacterium]|nr:alpha/beta fold hydrolase [Ktedonobacteraceae bacterium]